MKVVFLCSGLEPGRDGVGDYTRRLATELIRQGHSIAAISLNDKYILDKLVIYQHAEGIDLPVLRLPSSLPQNERFQEAKKYIDDFDPEWLSLQFVIFGFHPKGLPLGLGRQFKKIGEGRKWHIMFHELWLGMAVNASKKFIIWGGVQRYLIKRVLAYLKPKVVNTQTGLYKHHLFKLGFVSQILPLFSNIPKVDKGSASITQTSDKYSLQKINLIIFGTIHPKAPIEDLANDAAIYSAKNNIEITLAFVGRCGVEQSKWVDIWTERGLKAIVLGELPMNEISLLLSGASFGIATTQFAIIEKSGSVAAMLEHNLPVIAVPPPWVPSNYNSPNNLKGILLYKKGNFGQLMTTTIERAEPNNPATIARQLISVFLNNG